MRHPSDPPDPPEGVDATRPTAARVYNYMIGGTDYYPVDEKFADDITAYHPHAARSAVEGRAFLRRAVRLIAAAGVRQFIDIGTGLPSGGNVHEVAATVDPDTRTLYVDPDPDVVAHARELLHGVTRATVVRHRFQDVEDVLDAARAFLDLTEPVGLILSYVIHFVPPGDDPAALIRRYTDVFAEGSYVAISHGASDLTPQSTIRGFITGYRESMNLGVTLRDRREVAALLAGLRLVPPGVVTVTEWPQPSPAPIPVQFAPAYAGVGRVSRVSR